MGAGTAVKAKAGGAARIVLGRAHHRPSSRESYPSTQPSHHPQHQAPKRSYVSYERNSGCLKQQASHHTLYSPYRHQQYRQHHLQIQQQSSTTIDQSIQMLAPRSSLSTLRLSAGRSVRGGSNHKNYSTSMHTHSTTPGSTLPPGMETAKPITAPPPFNHHLHNTSVDQVSQHGSANPSTSSAVNIDSSARNAPPLPPAEHIATAASSVTPPEHAKTLPPAKRKTIVRRLVVGPFGTFHKGYSAANHRRPYITQLCTAIVTYCLGDLAAQSIEYYYKPKNTAGADTGTTGRSTEAAKSGSSTKESAYDPARTLRAAMTGAICAIPLYHWYIYLGRHFNHRTSRKISLAYKIFVNQLVFTPLFNAYFFGMQSLLSHVFRSPNYHQHHSAHGTSVGGSGSGSGSGIGSGSESGRGIGRWTTANSSTMLSSVGAKFSEAWTHITHTVPTSFVNSAKFWPLITAINYSFLDPHLRPLFANTMAIGWQAYLCLLNQRATLVEEQEEEQAEQVLMTGVQPAGLAAVHFLHAENKAGTAVAKA